MATISPGEININKLASSLKKNHATISEYLNILEEANLIRFLPTDRAGHSLVRHAKKVFLDNTNLMQAINNNLGKEVEIGTARELFALNQLQNAGYVPTYTPQGDLFIDGFTFEIGGKNKSDQQIKDIKNSYLLLDDIVIGDKNKIPLFLFGFLY